MYILHTPLGRPPADSINRNMSPSPYPSAIGKFKYRTVVLHISPSGLFNKVNCSITLTIASNYICSYQLTLFHCGAFYEVWYVWRVLVCARGMVLFHCPPLSDSIFLCSIGVIGLANRVSEFLSAKPVINNLSRCYIQLCLIQWSNSSS